MREVLVIKTGVANIASVSAAFARQDASVRLSDDPDEVRHAARVVLPGVGAFGPAMAQLNELGLAEALRERAQADLPLLGICLGLQLLCQSSEESPDVIGLSVFNERVTRFNDPRLRTPHFGWNAVTPTAGAQLLSSGWAYYANSYKLDRLPEGAEGAMTTHGDPFVAVIERGALLACQCHPELSGAWGANLLRAWLEMTCL